MGAILINFERTAMGFDHKFLIGVGLAAVLVGLFLWLGGLGFKRFLVAILGAVSGGICGFLIIRQNIAALFSAAAATIAAMQFERIFTTILATILAAVFTLIILSSPYIDNSAGTTPLTPVKISEPVLTTSVQGSVQTVKAYAVNFVKIIKHASMKLPMHKWIITVLVIVTVILASLSFWRLTSAFSCAALGTILIHAGMIFLLLYKGSNPITRIYQSSSFSLAVFTGMIVFGTIEQLLVCQTTKKVSKGKKQANKDKDAPDQTTQSWRTT